MPNVTSHAYRGLRYGKQKKRTTSGKGTTIVNNPKPKRPTEAFDWNHVLETANKFPELRVMHWKTYRKLFPEHMPSVKRDLLEISRTGKVFRLSDDLVWAITKLSLEIEPAVLLEHALACRLPFPTTIFEWNGEARSTSYKRSGVPVHDFSEVPDDERPCMTIQTAGRAVKVIRDFSYQIDEKSLCIFPITYWFDPEMEGVNPMAGVSDASRHYLRQPETFAAIAASYQRFTHWWLTSAVIAQHEDQARAIENDPHIGAYTYGPTAAAAGTMTNKLETHNVVMAGTAGNPRWFGALCVLLNQQKTIRYVEGHQTPDSPEAKPRKPSNGPPTTLTLFLPKEKVVTNIVRLVHNGARKKVGAHDVQGFWSISHKRGNETCQHAWPLEHTRRQVCSVCGALRWWKEEHHRGQGPTLKQRQRRLDYGGQDINRLEASLKKPDHAS